LKFDIHLHAGLPENGKAVLYDGRTGKVKNQITKGNWVVRSIDKIDDETIRRADIYIVHAKDVAQQDKSPDIWDAAQNGIVAWDDIHEIQELVAGRVKGRSSADQITLYNNNTGSGIQFAAVGAAVLQRARALGLGKELPTEWFLESVSP